MEISQKFLRMFGMIARLLGIAEGQFWHQGTYPDSKFFYLDGASHS